MSHRDQALSFRWHQVPLSGQWSAEWRGKINIPAQGNYTFATYTSDRAWVIIDDKPVISGAPSNATGQIALEKGMHDIVVKYVDTKGYSEFRVMWVPAGQDRQLIPDNMLFPN